VDSVRTRQPRAVRENDILTAAYSIFSARGYEKTAVSEIAKLAGVAEGTVYKYFESKQDLLAQVIARFYKKLIESTQTSLIGITGLENQLRVVISRHIDGFFEDIGLYRLLLQEVRPLDSYPHSEMHQLTRQYSEILLTVLEEGIVQGEIKPGISPQTIRDMIFGCLEHTGWNVLALNKAKFDRERLVNEVISITLGGVLAPTKSYALDADKQSSLDRNLERLERLVNTLERNNT